MNEYLKTGREEIAEQTDEKIKEEVMQYQEKIDHLKEVSSSAEIEKVTLKDIIGRKVSPKEGKVFKEYVKTGLLENIKHEGKLSNKSNYYKIY